MRMGLRLGGGLSRGASGELINDGQLFYPISLDAVLFNFEGIIKPTIGLSRWYPVVGCSLHSYRATIEVPSLSDIELQLKVNGVVQGSPVTIFAGQLISTVANVSVALSTADYLTADIVNGFGGADVYVTVMVQYIAERSGVEIRSPTATPDKLGFVKLGNDFVTDSDGRLKLATPPIAIDPILHVKDNYNVDVFIKGKPSPSELVFRSIASSAYNLSGVGEAIAETAATDTELYFSIKRNDILVGDIRFPIGEVHGIVTLSSQAMGIGDVLSIYAPIIQDTSFSTITISLGGVGFAAGVVAAGPKGDKGDKGNEGIGSSAYDLAVFKGFVGTVEDWLYSLQGQSAFDLAVALGFVGSKSLWLSSLIGDTGETGSEGLQGLQGLQGERGLQGEKGDKGLVGDTGAPGIGIQLQGAVATVVDLPAQPSSNGDAYKVDEDGCLYVWSATGYVNAGQIVGPAGESAYAIAVRQGFQGTEAEWLLSLKGANGTNGTGGDSGGFTEAIGSVILRAALGDDNQVPWYAPFDCTITRVEATIDRTQLNSSQLVYGSTVSRGINMTLQAGYLEGSNVGQRRDFAEGFNIPVYKNSSFSCGRSTQMINPSPTQSDIPGDITVSFTYSRGIDLPIVTTILQGETSVIWSPGVLVDLYAVYATLSTPATVRNFISFDVSVDAVFKYTASCVVEVGETISSRVTIDVAETGGQDFLVIDSTGSLQFNRGMDVAGAPLDGEVYLHIDYVED